MAVNYTIVVAFILYILAITGDVTTTWTSPMFIKLTSADPEINPVGRPITLLDQSWISSILNIGAILGAIPSGFMAQKYGRKKTLLVIIIPHFVAFIMFSFCHEVYLYLIARFLNGLALGGGYTLLPMYVGEISEDSNRGKLSTMLNIFWTFGNLISLGFGPFVSSTVFNITIAVISFTFFILFLLFAPESPYYLISKDNLQSAEKVLMKLRSKDETSVQDELYKIKDNVNCKSEGSILSSIRSKPAIKAIVVALGLMSIQQLSGITAIFCFGQLIFERSGSTFPSEINSVILGLVLFLSSFSTPLVIDRFGRKIILIFSTMGMCISLFTFGVYFYLFEATTFNTTSISFIPILSLLSYITFFNLGISPLAWIIPAELYPANLKSMGASLCAVWCRLNSFIVTRFFNDIVAAIGTYGAFSFFAIFCLLGTIFIFFYVPETLGKTYIEIQSELNGIKPDLVTEGKKKNSMNKK